MKHKTLYWFTHDLRLQDNELLQLALHTSEQITFIYIFDEQLVNYVQFNSHAIGKQRLQFIHQALEQLQQDLAELGHDLIILKGDSKLLIAQCVESLHISQIAIAKQIGWYEKKLYHHIVSTLPELVSLTHWQHTLFDQHPARSSSDLTTFSKFRKLVEKQQVHDIKVPLVKVNLADIAPLKLNKLLKSLHQESTSDLSGSDSNSTHCEFLAGEQAALTHLTDYLQSGAANTYKLTRDELDGWSNSTKFSPYLAIGSLSPCRIWHEINEFEAQQGANESTYWIKFELLWREFFQWSAFDLSEQLFSFQGSKKTKPLTSFFAERFKKWCLGNTPFPLVNACMKQLNATGYMSNRGRQIVASCLIYDLGIDWRYGAAYFQQQLLDYDVAANWGNWQYIAGVGADPKGGRHFNLTKQTQQYDPHGHFVSQWCTSEVVTTLDSTDMVDWPISGTVE